MTQQLSKPLESPGVLEYEPQPISLRPLQSARLGARLAMGMVLLATVVAAVVPGVRLRQWIYAESTPLRFSGDIGNAWMQGSAVLEAARQAHPGEPVTLSRLLDSYFTRYDAVLSGGGRGLFRLDYPPARLLVMSLWVWQMEDTARSRGLTPWNFPIVWPLLCLNTLFELAGCAGAYLLVRHVLRRQLVRGADLLALLAPLLMWFNLAALLDAHVWPQWEVWLIPFYTFAAYFAATRRWLAVGACIAIGAMFKGQMLITAAVFVLWPLFQMRWRGVLEVLVGALFATMVYVSPWMLRTMPALVLASVVLVLIVGGLYWIPRGWRVLYVTGGVVLTVLATGLLLDGSFAWWHVGFARGTTQYMSMRMGPTPNLGGLLESYGWRPRQTMFTIDWPWSDTITELSARDAMLFFYGIALFLCAVGIAHHDARNDRRMLIALATPWVVMFAFLAQMHDRYLVWGAVLTALAAGVSLGGTLLHLVVTALACLPLGFQLLRVGGSRISSDSIDLADSWLRFFQQSDPDAGWATVLAALVLLYLSLAPSRRRPAGSMPHQSWPEPSPPPLAHRGSSPQPDRYSGPGRLSAGR
jgi:hypothetical protein